MSGIDHDCTPQERNVLLDRIAELEAEVEKLRAEKQELLSLAEPEVVLLRKLEQAEAELAALKEQLHKCIDMSVCNERCPACQPFTTIFESPERAYGGCVVAYTDSNFHKDRAPLGEACPFYREKSDQ